MAPVFIVCLREPGSKTDYREDPYWEVGSFGCTGCHSRNILNPTGQHVADGARFAFAQGGSAGTRLLFVTPEIKLRSFGELTEATWQPPEMPFKYLDAPLLIDSDGETQFPRPPHLRPPDQPACQKCEEEQARSELTHRLLRAPSSSISPSPSAPHRRSA